MMGHAFGPLVADARDLDIGVRVGLVEQVAHMHVIEVDADNFEVLHCFSKAVHRKAAHPDRPPFD
jgi:hypothetical protein